MKSYVFTRKNAQNKDEYVQFVNDVEKLVKNILSNPGIDV